MSKQASLLSILHVLVDHKLDPSESGGIVALWFKWLQEGHPQSETEVHWSTELKSTPDHDGASSAVLSRTQLCVVTVTFRDPTTIKAKFYSSPAAAAVHSVNAE